MIGNYLATQHRDAVRPRSHRQRRIPVVAAAWAALLGLAVLGGCDGDNLFSEDSRSLQPRITEVVAPSEAQPGDSIEVLIGAIAPRNIASINVTVTGGVSLDTTIVPDGEVKSFSEAVKIGLPSILSDTVVIVSVSVTDAIGVTSPAVSGTLVVIGPPVITGLDGPETAAAGNTITLSVDAHGDRPLTSLAISATGAITSETTVTITPPARTVTDRAVQFTVPSPVQDTVIDFTVTARDADNRVSAPATLRVLLAVEGPRVTEVTSIPADSIAAGRTLDLRVTAEGQRPITELRVRYRGAAEEDQSITINPARTEVTEETSITLPLEVRDTLLTISVTAVDAAASLSPVFSTTIRVRDVTGPTVAAALSQATASAGSTVAVQVTASDNIGLSQIGIFALNSAGDTLAGDVLVNTAGISRDTVFDYTIPGSLTPQTLQVFAQAIDVQGLRSVSSALTLTVADSAMPGVTITTPAEGSNIPLGDSVLVTVDASDPSGIQRIDLEGFSIRTPPAQDAQKVARFDSRTIEFPQVPETTLPTSVTIQRWLTATSDTTSEDAFIVAAVTDSLGNVGVDTVSVYIGGPRVTMEPTGSLSRTINVPFQVRATAHDAVGKLGTLRLILSGVINDTILATGTDEDSLAIDTQITATTTGTLNIRAEAENERGIIGTAPASASISVVSAGSDASPPRVSIDTLFVNRAELDDSLGFVIEAEDVGAAGLERVGIFVRAMPLENPPQDTVSVIADTVFVGAQGGLYRDTLYLRLEQLGFDEATTDLPLRIRIEAHVFAYDAGGFCGANNSATLATFTCADTTATEPGDASSQAGAVRANAEGVQYQITAVAGGSVQLQNPDDNIADLIVDPAQERLFLSNYSRNRLEVLPIGSEAFGTPVVVGSQPWGMFINLDSTRLMVANSGGTNISFVDITGASPAEQAAERILTPNAVLIDVFATLDDGVLRYTVDVHDFSDRPQFIAQDVEGTLLYSTRPTEAAESGTVRYLLDSAPRREARILVNRESVQDATDWLAIANIDSLNVYRPVNGDDQVAIWDHANGGNVPIFSDTLPLDQAITAMETGGSDIVVFAGRWDLEAVGLSDTTYVAASGDRNAVLFGEGGTGDIARIWLWTPLAPGSDPPGTISDGITVRDLVNNASEEVLGVGLNSNGSVGVGRGSESAFFFSNDVALEGDLRLQGTFSEGMEGARGGVALHPRHDYDMAAGSNENTLAFIATSSNTIKVVDTFHFYERGEIAIRDNIVGPLRASLPMASDNTGVTAGSCEEVIVKLYGMTDDRSAVIINVRRRDIHSPAICTP